MSPPRGRRRSVAAVVATTAAIAATGRLYPTLRMPPETDTRRIALISDVHGNLPAFQAVLRTIEEEGVDGIWCLATSSATADSRTSASRWRRRRSISA